MEDITYQNNCRTCGRLFWTDGAFCVTCPNCFQIALHQRDERIKVLEAIAEAAEEAVEMSLYNSSGHWLIDRERYTALEQALAKRKEE